MSTLTPHGASPEPNPLDPVQPPEQPANFARTDFGPHGQGLPNQGMTCANGHANVRDSKFCSTCGVAMPPITVSQHERIDTVRAGAPLPPSPPLGEFGEDIPGYIQQINRSGNVEYVQSPGIGYQATPFIQPDERDRPKVGMLWLWWFVFSPVVLFLAPSYSNKAKRLGFKETGRYWVPWWLTLGGYAALVILVIVATNVKPSYSTYSGSSYTYTAPTTTQTTAHGTTQANGHVLYSVTQESGDAYTLANLIGRDHTTDWTTDTGAATSSYPTSAVCESNYQSNVAWHYNCNITFVTGQTSSYWVDWDGPGYNTYSAARRTQG